MSHPLYSTLTPTQGKYLSKFSGLALLSWGFSPAQIQSFWNYQYIEVEEKIPACIFQTAWYESSKYKIGSTSPRYLYFNLNFTAFKQLPDLSNSHRKYLAMYTRPVLKAWGFENRFISALYNENFDDFMPVIPQWLEYYNTYLESGLTFTTGTKRTAGDYTLPPVTIPHHIPGDYTLPPVTIPHHIPNPIGNDEPEEVISPLFNDTPHDLEVKYQGTYGLHNNRVIYFSNACPKSSAPHKYEILFKYINPNGTKSSAISYDISEFNMAVPKLGYINHSDCAILLERKHKKSSPSRYRRALRADGLSITSLSHNELMDLQGSDPYDIYFYGDETVINKITPSLFFPEFLSYQDAIASLLSFKRLSCAISSTLAMALDFKANKIYLYKHQWPIAHFDMKAKAFVTGTSIFNNDLQKAGVVLK
jgi:hypothetical protein